MADESLNQSEIQTKAHLSIGRAIVLDLILVVVFVGVISIIVTLMGFIGAYLAGNNIVPLEELTAPRTIIIAIIIGSIVLSAFVCSATYFTFIRPIRHMTYAVGQLAKGNFAFRIKAPSKKFHIREVKEFSESFNTTATELQNTEMMRAGFISDFSHEFRTPITSLSGFAQLLMEDDLSDEERKEYLEIIYEESHRLSGLSERILSLSKMEASTILPKVEPVNIATQLEHTVLLLDSKLNQNNLKVTLNIDSCIIQGNPDYLAQLWLNLLDNAIKFSPLEGHIDIALYKGHDNKESHDSIRTKPDSIHAKRDVTRTKHTASSDYAVVWISDEGCGMDTETMARIFDRFYQGDTSHASAGSGLGLALCKRIVELHKGTIEVQSAPGKGSVFEVRLPCSTN